MHKNIKKRKKKVLIFTALLVIGFLSFCTPQDKEDELLIDLIGMEKGEYLVESINVFSADYTKGKGFDDGFSAKKAIYAPLDEDLSNAIMEQIESYTATESIKDLPKKIEGYLLFLDASYDSKDLWLFYSEEEQGYLIDVGFEDKTLLIKDSKLFEIIDEAYKNSVKQ